MNRQSCGTRPMSLGAGDRLTVRKLMTQHPTPTARPRTGLPAVAMNMFQEGATGGFQHTFWVLGAIGLLAIPAIFALVRRNELSDAVAKTTVREPQPALAATS
jgi:hypothetical protein